MTARKQESIVFRVDPTLKRNFELSCEEAGTSTSHLLRQFMSKFIEDQFIKKAEKIRLDDPPKDEDTYTDPKTGTLYSPREKEDILFVKKNRVIFDAFEKMHRAKILPYPKREANKQEGYSLVRNKELPLKDRVRGAELVMEAHFSRSVASSLQIENPFSYLDHPAISEYAQHYFATNCAGVLNDDPELEEALTKKYPKPKTENQIDNSYWRF